MASPKATARQTAAYYQRHPEELLPRVSRVYRPGESPEEIDAATKRWFYSRRSEDGEKQGDDNAEG